MIYVTSDWHGCDPAEIEALFRQANFKENDFCFVLGGVTDVGEHGVALLEWLMAQYNVELILGANEHMLLMHEALFDDDPAPLTPAGAALLKKWNDMGALPTITALKAKKAEEREYIFEYLHDAALYDTVEVRGRDYILTHSGLGGFKKDKKLGDYDAAELIWNTPKLTDRYFDHAVTVFGHTPTEDLGEAYAGKILTTDTWIDVCAGAPALLRLDDGKTFYAE